MSKTNDRIGDPKSNVFTSGSPVANPKFGPNYSLFITIFLF
jgi:hypothetical protein